MNWLDRIITLYLQVSKDYDAGLCNYCERFTNHADLLFKDEEIATIYMFGTMEGLRTKKQIHSHAMNYWRDLFPKLPKYEAFVHRVNQLGDMFLAMIDKY